MGETSTFGATYMKFYADKLIRPDRDGLDVFDVRAFTSPFQSVPGLSFEVEYAHEDERRRASAPTPSTGRRATSSTTSTGSRSSPIATPASGATTWRRRTNEGFDSLLPGFYDWGSWWQGEIAGKYFLSNSNLISHQVRLHLTPTDAIGTGLIFFKFSADKAGRRRSRRDLRRRRRRRWTGTWTGS